MSQEADPSIAMVNRFGVKLPAECAYKCPVIIEWTDHETAELDIRDFAQRACEKPCLGRTVQDGEFTSFMSKCGLTGQSFRVC